MGGGDTNRQVSLQRGGDKLENGKFDRWKEKRKGPGGGQNAVAGLSIAREDHRQGKQRTSCGGANAKEESKGSSESNGRCASVQSRGELGSPMIQNAKAPRHHRERRKHDPPVSPESLSAASSSEATSCGRLNTTSRKKGRLSPEKTAPPYAPESVGQDTWRREGNELSSH